MRILQIRPTPPLRLRYAAASLRKATTQPASDHDLLKARNALAAFDYTSERLVCLERDTSFGGWGC